MAKQTWSNSSGSPISIAPPNDFVPEKDKSKDWYQQYARWIVSTFYNQPRNLFNTGNLNEMGLAQESIQNWSYVNANQENYRYKYATTNFDGNELPAVWVPGGKIGSLVDHLRGVLLGSIDNIEVTAKNLSKGVASEKAMLKEKLLLQYDMKEILKTLPPGISFNPVNDPEAELNSKEEIERYVDSWQDKYAIVAEKIGESQIYIDDLKEKFLQAGTNQYVGGVDGIYTEVMNGMVTNTVVPTYELIWDNRVDDPFNKQALITGFVKHAVPYQEVIQRFKDEMTEEEANEIRLLAQSGYENQDVFNNYYNTNFGWNNRFLWWNRAGTSQMTISYATVFFIAPTDWGYKKTRNLFGSERYTKIDPNKEYDINGKKLKGIEVNGDFSGWDVYQATLVGNKYIYGFGKMNNVLREKNAKGRPMLPIRVFCNNMALGQGKSVVKKMVPNQDKLDFYAYKIMQLVGRDSGKTYVFNGNKLGKVAPSEVMNDLKSFGVHVAQGLTGETDDPTNQQRMVEGVDMSLDDNIIRYIELASVVEQQMESDVSVSRLALGQQTGRVGKAEQENTIAQNSFGTATLQWGLMKHFSEAVQYNVNLKQMLYQFSDSVEEALVIGDEGSYLLNILDPKEFGTQSLLTYLDIFSTLDPTQRAELKSIALAEAQNGRLDVMDYLENVLMAPTMNQALRGLKLSKNKQAREASQAQQAQSNAEMQHEANLAQQVALNEASLIQLKEDNANYREQLKAMNQNIQMVVQMLSQAPPESPLQNELAAAGQPQQAEMTNQQPL